MRAQRAKQSAKREVSGVIANFGRLKLKEGQIIYREHIHIKCEEFNFLQNAENCERVAQSLRAQRAKLSAKREFSGAFANFERLKLKEGQKNYREHILMKCSKFNFLLNAKNCERIALSMRAQRAKFTH